VADAKHNKVKNNEGGMGLSVSDQQGWYGFLDPVVRSQHWKAS
jgi:hypothetical protein